MRKFIQKFLVWLMVLGLLFLGTIYSGTTSVKAAKTKIPTPAFSSPDKSNVYYDGQKITIIADYRMTNLNVTANLSVVDKNLSEKTPVMDNEDGTYTLKTLKLSGNSMIIGSNIVIYFTAEDEAGHTKVTPSTYLVNTKLRPIKDGSVLKAPVSLTVVPADSQIQIYWSRIAGAKKISIFYKDEKGIKRQMVVSASYGDAVIRNLQNDFTYSFNVAGIDKDGLKGPAKTISGTPYVPVKIIAGENIAPSQEVVIAPAISSGVRIAKVPQKVIAQAPKPETSLEVPVTPQVAKADDTKETDTRNWNRLLLAISILIVALGAAVGGYYGYEWYMARKDEPLKPQDPKNKNRW